MTKQPVIKSNSYLSVNINEKFYSFIMPENSQIGEMLDVLFILAKQVRSAYDNQLEQTKIPPKEEVNEIVDEADAIEPKVEVGAESMDAAEPKVEVGEKSAATPTKVDADPLKQK